MSQQQAFSSSGIPGAANVEFVAGNTGGNVPPNPATHVINIIGDTVQGVNINGNAGTFTETVTVSSATTAQIGVTSLATNLETVTGTVTTKATTPDDIKAKLGTQTLHGLPYGNSTTGAIQWLAEATNGQIPIGSTGNAPVLANITSTDGSVTITNGPGTINLSSQPGIAPNYTNVTTAMSPYTVTATDYFISCDATAGPITIRLPNAPTTKREFVVKDRVGIAATNNITVTTVGGAVNIDGAPSYIFTDNFESLEMLFNGTTYESF